MATPTYCSQADCINYIPGLVIDDSAAFDLLILTAERDIDNLCATRPVLTSGKRFDPTQMTAIQVTALTNGTCAQVEYRLRMGPEFFIQPQYKSVRGPEFATEGQRPYIGPKVKRELGLAGLLVTASGGRARP